MEITPDIVGSTPHAFLEMGELELSRRTVMNRGIYNKMRRNKKVIVENLHFFVFIMIPIVCAIYFVPGFINPFTIDEFKINFKVILLLRTFCEVRPEECACLLYTSRCV